MSLEWVKAGYKDSHVQSVSHITTLEFQWSEGNYNIFQTVIGDLVVVFSNQTKLLDYIRKNEGSIFLIKFLLEDSTIYKYTVDLGGGHKADALTLARAVVMVPGTLEDPRRIRYYADDLLTIE